MVDVVSGRAHEDGYRPDKHPRPNRAGYAQDRHPTPNQAGYPQDRHPTPNQAGYPQDRHPTPNQAGYPQDRHLKFNDESAGPRPKRGAHRIRKPREHRSFWKELPILIVVALLLTFMIQQFVARVYMIPSGSMERTLHGCPGCTPDRVLVDKLVYRFTDPEPGDVVVFTGPGPWTENDVRPVEPSNAIAGFFQQVGSLIGLAPPDERDFVKRIIAVGGQTVECCDKENRVLVDGKPLDEPYIHWAADRESQQREFAKVVVPDGTVWVMGDNRNNSSDSRVQGGGGARGTVPVQNIIGKARVIVLPPGRWGGISDYNPQRAHSAD